MGILKKHKKIKRSRYKLLMTIKRYRNKFGYKMQKFIINKYSEATHRDKEKKNALNNINDIIIHNKYENFSKVLIEFALKNKADRDKEFEMLDAFKNIKFHLVTPANNYKVELYGSLEQGIATFDSDIDISVTKNEHEVIDIETEKKELIKIKKILEKSFLSFNISPILNAKIPILKGVYKNTDINFDLSYNRKDGLNLTKKIKEIIKEEPMYKYIMIILKKIFIKAEIIKCPKSIFSPTILFHLIYILHSKLQKNKNKYSSHINYYIDSSILYFKDIRINLFEFLYEFFSYFSEYDLKSCSLCYLEKGFNQIDENNFIIQEILDPNKFIIKAGWKYKLYIQPKINKIYQELIKIKYNMYPLDIFLENYKN